LDQALPGQFYPLKEMEYKGKTARFAFKVKMEVTATAKNLRISPQKARLVVDQIKKMKPQDAVEVLEFLPQKSSLLLKKVIQSAMANAKNNHDIAEESLKFNQIQVGKGPMFKRYRAVAKGRAHSILKRTSNVRVVLEGQKKAATPVTNENRNENTADSKKLKSLVVAKERNEK